MSELRSRTLAPPPPRHPTARSPTPTLPPRPNRFNPPPPPVHPSHPSLPPQPPLGPRPDARITNSSPDPIPPQGAAPLDTAYSNAQGVPPPGPPNLPDITRSISEETEASTSSVDIKPVGSPIPPPKHPNVSPEFPQPISLTSSLNSTTGSPPEPPPMDHARRASSFTSESAYEATLSERELRDLYDDEEIDRFLRLFSAHVNEVQLNDGSQSTTNAEPSAAAGGVVVDDTEDDDKDWVSLNEAGGNLGLPYDGNQPRSISEQIAQKFVVPYLPKTSKKIPPFTVNKFRLTIQRLYLTLEPGYRFVIDNLVSLAIWEDKNKSLMFCLGYWVLWINNLLLPSLVFYTLYVLLDRRMHPYPSLEQLREHRGNIDKADEFGEELQARLTSTAPFGLLDAWKTFRVYNKSKVRKAKERIKQSDDAASMISIETTVTDDDTSAGDSLGRPREYEIKALGLEVLCELVDGMERLKNIFLWRKPSVSYAFSIALGVVGFVTLILPAKWLAKITYFIVGFLFWHVSPVLAALPAGDHRRVLMLTYCAPTDTDYAMELIAQRVARGQEVKPLHRKRKHAKKADVSGPADMHSRDLNEDEKSGFIKHGASLLKTGYQAIGGQQFIHHNFAPAAVRDVGPDSNSRSYPAQYGKTSGVITVSTEKFYFTPLLAGSKLEIPAEDIVGIKKALPKGISIRVKDASQEDGERKERFILVYERDELFGRLVGMGGKKWTKI